MLLNYFPCLISWVYLEEGRNLWFGFQHVVLANWRGKREGMMGIENNKSATAPWGQKGKKKPLFYAHFTHDILIQNSERSG